MGVAPLWAVDVLYVVWAAVALALVFAAARLYRVVFDPAYRMEGL
jgi:hypothetical protein